MKQSLLKRTLLLLCALVVGSASVWAEEKTDVLTASLFAATGTTYADFSGVSAPDGSSAVYAGNSAKTNDGAIQLRSTNNNAGIVTTTSGGVAKKISIKWNSSTADARTLSVYGKTGVYSAATDLYGDKAGSLIGDYKKSDGDKEITIEGGYTYIGIRSKSGALYLDEIDIIWETSGGGGGGNTAVDLDADAFKYSAANYTANLGGSNTFPTLTNTNSLDVTYQSTVPAVASIDASGMVTILTEGKTTIKAIFAGNESYNAKTVSYELTVVDPSYSTLWSENFSTYEKDDVPNGGTFEYVCVNGGSDTKIYDATLAGGVSPELLVGKSSGSFTATIPLDKYAGNLKLTYKTNAKTLSVSTTTDGITGSGSFNTAGSHEVVFTGITAETTEITIVFKAGSDNVRLDDIELKGKMAAPVFSPAAGDVVAGTEVTLSATAGAAIYYTINGDEPTTGSTLYSGAITINETTTIKAIAVKDDISTDVASATFTVNVDPFITLSSTSVEATAAEKDGSITVTYGNLTNYDADIYWYEADGTTPATYDWIDAEINSTTFNLDYTIAENTTYEGRAAYLKVYALGDEGEVYSDLITITQAGKVIDYATLPFSWNDNTTPTGVTNNGVGTYNSAPFLKFDTTGDFIILKVNEAATSLAFDIKGNNFADGTFKVQTSADGENYMDLATYTSLGDTKTMVLYLASTVRYIKWVYTTKVTGNVALGNINITTDVKAAVGAAGYTTLVTPAPLDFTGVTAYKVSAVNASSVTLEEITEAAASTPVIIAAAAGTYTLNVKTGAAAVTGNQLLASDGTATTTNAQTIYVLANKGEVGFYPVEAGVLVPAGKAYINGPAAVKGFLGFDFEGTATGVEEVSGSKIQVSSAPLFNLAGQRVNKATKGVFIQNGRKYIK